MLISGAASFALFAKGADFLLIFSRRGREFL
jgi:hypothetical protein